MKNILPAKSRISIREPKQAAKFYTTKKDVELTGITTVRCPIRGNRDVQTVTVAGIELFFLPAQVQVRVDFDLNAIGNLFKLDYDIPTGTVLEDGHPSGWLWQYAVRTTKSCWMIPANRINAIMVRLDRLTEAGVIWDMTKQDISETPKLIGQCVQALRREVDGAIARAAESNVDSQITLDATPATANPNTARKAHLKRAEDIQKRTDVLFAKLTEAAKVFGIDPTCLNMTGARSVIAATRASMRERARLFVEGRNAARALQTSDGKAVAAAVTAGEMDPVILADYLQDHDEVEKAEALRMAFAGEPETFSLAGLGEDD